MVFSSSVFLFAFLPLFLAVYLVVPTRSAKNVILLLFSLFFYAWGEPIYVFLMIGSIIVNWFFGMWMSKCAAGGGSPSSAHRGAVRRSVRIVPVQI